MLISIEGLKVSINHTPILHDVHLSLDKGEICGLLGPNGAGKSTTISAVLGLRAAEAGRIEMFDQQFPDAVSEIEVRQKTGVLPEQGGFYDWMDAIRYLAFFASLYGREIHRKEIQDRLQRVGLDPSNERPIHTFSRGMKQRLGLARALLANPKLVILDEPTNGLDPRGRRDIHDIFLGLAAEGVGILLCTHLLDDVERLCSRVGIIVDGRTVAEGPVDELLRNSGKTNRFRLRLTSPPSASQQSGMGLDASIISHDGEWWIVSIDPGASPDSVWRELFFRGWKITDIQQESGGIEDMYLSLTDRSPT